MTYFVPIVEGHGELDAVPVLLRRVCQEAAPPVYPQVNKPIRIKAGSFLRDQAYFVKYIMLAAAKARQVNGHVLILLDCEDDCPATVGPALLARAQAVQGDVEYLVVLAYREFETWFLAAAASLAGKSGLPKALTPPPEPEAIRDAKGWLGQQMPGGYDPVLHQAAFAAQFDLQAAEAVPSFQRLRRRIGDILSAAPNDSV